jgi:hypothetical protein
MVFGMLCEMRYLFYHAQIGYGEPGLSYHLGILFGPLLIGVFLSYINKDIISLVGATNGTEAAAMKLMELAYSRHSSDNITCIVVRFHH